MAVDFGCVLLFHASKFARLKERCVHKFLDRCLCCFRSMQFQCDLSKWPSFPHPSFAVAATSGFTTNVLETHSAKFVSILYLLSNNYVFDYRRRRDPKHNVIWLCITRLDISSRRLHGDLKCFALIIFSRKGLCRILHNRSGSGSSWSSKMSSFWFL